MGKTTFFNSNQDWLHLFLKKYCDNIQPGDYTINADPLQTATKKLQSNKSPSNNLID